MVRALAQPGDMPNPRLTPGAIATTDVATVCRSGYARSVRTLGEAWRRLREAAYHRYGIARGHRSALDAHGHRHPLYAIDHLVPLEIGGAPSDLRNLWPQAAGAARRKDHVEDALHALVCSGAMRIRDAQAAIARDWKTAVPATSSGRSLDAGARALLETTPSTSPRGDW